MSSLARAVLEAGVEPARPRATWFEHAASPVPPLQRRAAADRVVATGARAAAPASARSARLAGRVRPDSKNGVVRASEASAREGDPSELASDGGGAKLSPSKNAAPRGLSTLRLPFRHSSAEPPRTASSPPGLGGSGSQTDRLLPRRSAPGRRPRYGARESNPARPPRDGGVVPRRLAPHGCGETRTLAAARMRGVGRPRPAAVRDGGSPRSDRRRFRQDSNLELGFRRPA